MTEYTISIICDLNKYALNAKDKFDAIQYLDTSSITDGHISNIQNIEYSEAPSRAKRKVSDKTIVFSTVRPNLRHFGILYLPAENFIVSTGFVTIDVKAQYKEKIVPEYVYLLLTQPTVIAKLQMVAESAVTSYPSINPSDIGALSFDFPDYETQKRIASVLSNIDRKIALNRAMNEELEQTARDLYDYWFLQFDFPDANGKPYRSSGGKMVYNPQLKREIPQGWEVGKLEQLANITMGQSPAGFSYNERGEGMIFYQGSTDFGARFPSIRMFTTEPSRFAKKGDILMSVRAPVGTLNIANTDCCIGRGLAALNSKLGSMTHLFYVLLDLKTAFDARNVAGTTFGSITKDDLHNLSVLLPQKEIVANFETICSSMYDEQMKMEEATNSLRSLRDELLPLLMNGQVEVKD